MKTKTHIIGFLALATLFASSAFATDVGTPVAAPSAPTAPSVTGSTAPATDASASALLGQIEKVSLVDSLTLSVNLANVSDLKMPSNPAVEGESSAKIWEEVKMTAEKSADSAKKILVNLEAPLIESSSYSIISLGDTDASMDFTYAAGILDYPNSALVDGVIGIEKVVVAGPTQLEINFNQDYTGAATDFKLFKVKKVSMMFFENNVLNLKLTDTLEASKDYNLILEMKDSSGKDVEFENNLYDFSTPAELVSAATPTDSVEEMPLDGSGELNAATPSDTGSGMPIEAVAGQVTETPNTGATTNIMFLLGLTLAAGIFIIRRKTLKS